MEEPRRLFGTNGIRGIVNEELTPEFAIRVAQAIGTFFNHGEILLGFDGRSSNTMLANAVTSGIVSTGCNVHDCGMAPTPCVQFAVKNHKLSGGVMITASHNPPEYNGLKVLWRDGVEISRKQEIEVEKIFAEGNINIANWSEIGKKSVLQGALNEYKAAIIRQVNSEAIKRKGYTIVVDAGNGVGGLVTPYLLRELGCQVITINVDVQGFFPNRQSEPKPENLKQLMATVKSVKADFGVAFDGDADRSIFIDEEGEVQWGDRTFAIIAKSFLQSNPGETVVTPVSSSLVVKDIVDEYDGKLIVTKVGSTIVSHTMKRVNAKLGGEENGGVFYGPHQPVRDGAMTAALILEMMATTNRSLSDLLNELPQYYLTKDKMRCSNIQKAVILKELISRLKHLNPNTIDGVKLVLDDKSSILIRPSGTEELIRLYAEAQTQKQASNLIKEYKNIIKDLMVPLDRT